MFSGHGIAYKKNFQDSWRAKDKKSIIDTVLSHLINLILNISGDFFPSRDIALINKNEDNGFYDSCHLAGVLKNGALYSLTASWGSPLKNIVKAYFSDGIWTYDYDKGRIIEESPRDVFDSKGFFIPPNMKIKNSKINGLENSIKHFFDKLLKNQQDIFEFNKSQLTIKFLEEFTLHE